MMLKGLRWMISTLQVVSSLSLYTICLETFYELLSAGRFALFGLSFQPMTGHTEKTHAYRTQFFFFFQTNLSFNVASVIHPTPHFTRSLASWYETISTYLFSIFPTFNPLNSFVDILLYNAITLLSIPGHHPNLVTF